MIGTILPSWRLLGDTSNFRIRALLLTPQDVYVSDSSDGRRAEIESREDTRDPLQIVKHPRQT